MTNKEIAIKHATDILEGNIVSNIYLKQAAKRFFNFLENPNYYFDELELNKICKFIQKLTLSEDFVGLPFILENWQIFFISSVFAFKYKDGEEKDCRVVKTATLEIPRKNAKSMIASALALYDLLTSNNQAQIYLVATSRENVKAINFKKVKEFSKQIDKTGKVIKPRYNSLLYKGNILTALSSDAGRHQGYSPSTVIIDEAHEIQSGELFQVFQRGMGSRKKRLTLIITSSGNDTNVYYYQLREQYIKILFNEIQDDSVCAHIYCLDEGDDYTDENNWIKANPNLGVSCLKSYLQGEVHTAETNSLDRNSVLTYNFGVWLKSSSSDEIWIEEKYFNKALQSISINTFNNREVIVGIDLASTRDIAAVTYYFPPTEEDNRHYFFNRYYLPSDNINTNVNRLKFKEAQALGEIKLTEGNVIDYDYILEDLKKQNELTPIQAIYYDRYNSTQFIISCTEEGFYTLPFSQSAGNLNEPLKQFERLIMNEVVVIEKNSITKWMLNNVVIDVDKYGNYKLNRKTKSKKIDGVASIIDAFGGYMKNPAPNFTIV